MSISNYLNSEIPTSPSTPNRNRSHQSGPTIKTGSHGDTLTNHGNRGGNHMFEQKETLICELVLADQFESVEVLITEECSLKIPIEQ